MFGFAFLFIIFQLSFFRIVHSDICSNERACGQCITVNADCGWCSQDNYPRPRCSSYYNHIKSGCFNSSIEFPKNEIFTITNHELSRVKVASEHEAIQVKPQFIRLNLRPHKVETINLTYRQAVDYPVDLYYLMDLSRTMLVHKKTLATLGNELAKQMRLITRNFRLGFGSFIDKSVQPFTDTNPSKLQHPCLDCASPYAFKHSMSLDTDTDKFTKLVEESPISGNIDGPEGTFDAIMQSIVCREKIGWRRDARHLLIVTTDAGFHSAGDGRLAGIIKPNDEQCHLDSNGLYAAEKDQDYPSINQINMVSQENNVHIIFSIAENRIAPYEQLHKKIKSSSVAQLSRNSSNIVEIIKNEYKKLTSNVQLMDNSSEHLSLTYYSTCLSKGSIYDDLNYPQTSICEGLQVDSQVMFKVKIELNSCPQKKSQRREIIKINPIGLEEGLIVEVNMLCDCNCESSRNQIKSSPKCNGKGTDSCGICTCDRGSFGSRCECDANGAYSDDDSKCRSGNDTRVCSGRGNCVCGQCSCFQVSGHLYSGEYCQCDDLACDYYQGQLCGGSSRGTCRCGRCSCSDIYSGSDCSCPLSKSTCIDPTNGMVCNGRGNCVCGSCSCNSTQYSGPFCDECSNCHGQCPLYVDLVSQQIINGTLELRTINESTGSLIISTLVNDSIMIVGDKQCQFFGADECAYSFTYNYGSSSMLKSSPKKSNENLLAQLVTIKISPKRVCPQPINLSAYIVQYVGSIVIIGLITLLVWRLITFMLDRHEYEKFLKACASVDFPENQNPLFKPSTSKFENPAYDES